MMHTDRHNILLVCLRPAVIPCCHNKANCSSLVLSQWLAPIRSGVRKNTTLYTARTGMVLETIAKCDVDIRKELYGGVVLTGGTALLTGVRAQP